MGFKFNNQTHVLNTIKKCLREVSISLNDIDEEYVKEIIEYCWYIESSDNEKKTISENNAYMPLSKLTWITYLKSFESSEEYIDNLKELSRYYTLLFDLKDKEKVLKVEPESKIIFKKDDLILKAHIGEGVYVDLEEKLKYLVGKPGVYFLYGRDESLIYVGKSSNLGVRIAQSISNKCAYFYEVAETGTMSDASVYEMYYIALLKPSINRDGNHSDRLGLYLPCIRNFSKENIRKDVA